MHGVVDGEVPESMRDKRVLSLDLGALLAGVLLPMFLFKKQLADDGK